MTNIVPEGTDKQDDEDGDVTVSITLYPADGDEKALRQIGYGVTPFLLIEPEYDESTNTTSWNFVGSWIEDFAEMVDLMESALDILKAGIEQNERPGGDA